MMALGAAREHAIEMQRVLDDQLSLVDSIRGELNALDARRNHAQGRTVEALKLSAVRRRWLVFDLQKEEFYLDTMESDVSRADRAVQERLAEWRRLRARLEAFDALGAEQVREAARRAQRRADAEVDDRPARTGASRTASATIRRVGS